MKKKNSQILHISRRKAAIIGGAVALTGFGLGAAFYLSQTKQEKLEPQIAKTDDTSDQGFIDYALAPRYLGSTSAAINIIEFFSMTCSHCASFHQETFPMVKKRLINENLIRFEMRPFPLDGLALRAHAMARSLPLDKYYPMVDMLMEKQPIWTTAEDPIAALRKLANLAGLSGNEFDTIMRNRPLLEGIVKMRQNALKDWDIKATPSFVFNNKTIFSGNLSYNEFTEKMNATAA